MLNLVVLSLTLLLSAVLIFSLQKGWRRRSRAARKRASMRVAGTEPAQTQSVTRKLAGTKPKSYAAVGVRPHPRACGAIEAFYSKRFLAGEAPAVPVAGCTVIPCPCRYIHFRDRREDERRVKFGIRNAVHQVRSMERRRGDRRHAPVLS